MWESYKDVSGKEIHSVCNKEIVSTEIKDPAIGTCGKYRDRNSSEIYSHNHDTWCT